MAKAVKTSPGVGARPAPRIRRSFYDTPFGLGLFNAAEYLIWAALLGAGVAIVYLGVGLYQGDLARVATVQEALKYHVASLVLAYSFILLYVAALIRGAQEKIYFYLFLIIGVLMHFGIPLIVNWALGSQAATAMSINPGVTLLLRNSFFGAKALLILAGGQFGYFIYCHFAATEKQPQQVSKELDRIIKLSRRMPAKNVHVKKGAFAPCWELPHCIDYIKELCDPWAKKVACWKLDTGCMCNMSYLARSIKLQGERGSMAYHNVASAEKAIEQFYSTRQVECADCRIYLEHQRRKFRFFSPLAFPITVILIWILHPLLLVIYQGAVDISARAVHIFSFSHDAPQRSAALVDLLSTPALAWVVIGLFGIFLLSGVLRVIEWIVLDLKW